MLHSIEYYSSLVTEGSMTASFASAILKEIGAPITPNNIDYVLRLNDDALFPVLNYPKMLNDKKSGGIYSIEELRELNDYVDELRSTATFICPQLWQLPDQVGE